jgi:hypothetical protein
LIRGVALAIIGGISSSILVACPILLSLEKTRLAATTVGAAWLSRQTAAR